MPPPYTFAPAEPPTGDDVALQLTNAFLETVYLVSLTIVVPETVLLLLLLLGL
jgi:hypothetical protein